MLKLIVLAVVVATACAAPAYPTGSKVESSEESITSKPTVTIAPSTLAPALAPASQLSPGRSPASAKALSAITEIRTPASTTKLTHLVAPLATSVAAAPILSPLQVSAYAYALPAALPSLELAAAPSTYSIEQHGYRIIY